MQSNTPKSRQEESSSSSTNSCSVGAVLSRQLLQPADSRPSTTVDKYCKTLCTPIDLLIFNAYFARSSPSELDIEHNLPADVVTYRSRAVDEAKGAAKLPELNAGSVPAVGATHVQAWLRHHERTVDHILWLMAIDQVLNGAGGERAANRHLPERFRRDEPQGRDTQRMPGDNGPPAIARASSTRCGFGRVIKHILRSTNCHSPSCTVNHGPSEPPHSYLD
ncbi:hypothetical protein PCASD_02314 [Puccinia coronata f. sp. avenae]|uniref:Uncharacterized protein n=1 Tax=Puccinia coronata f. sp. avenae TaxID=200324 RepID=A0A2N5VB13_9BASI|nr:hypothetical protein PCASD_02314 [Puccinia coronata f. sp. avenae]